MIGKSYIFHLFLFLLILPDSIYSQDNICLIPQVESMVRKKGTLSIERLESIHFPDEWKNTGNLLVSDLKELANLSVMVNASNPSIHVKKVKMQEPEMYMLEITKQGIIIEAGDQTGMIHAFSTLLQLILGSEGKELPRLIIHDKPRFSYRGVMIDCSRHFWTIEQLKKYTKQLAFFKLNTLHLHLTDNQGWRLYLDQYPDLAFKGTYYRTFEDLSGHYYRKSELQELINYAAMCRAHLYPGTGAVPLVHVLRAGQAGGGHGSVRDTGVFVGTADGPELVRRHCPAGRSRDPGAHHGLCQCHHRPGGGVPHGGLCAGRGGEDVHHRRAGDPLRCQRQRGLWTHLLDHHAVCVVRFYAQNRRGERLPLEGGTPRSESKISMTATGSHVYFYSLRGAQPYTGEPFYICFFLVSMVEWPQTYGRRGLCLKLPNGPWRLL